MSRDFGGYDRGIGLRSYRGERAAFYRYDDRIDDDLTPTESVRLLLLN